MPIQQSDVLSTYICSASVHILETELHDGEFLDMFDVCYCSMVVGVWGVVVCNGGCHSTILLDRVCVVCVMRTYRYQPITRVYRIRTTNHPRPACMSVSRSPSNAPAMVHVFAVSLSLSFTRPPLAFDKTQQFRFLLFTSNISIYPSIEFICSTNNTTGTNNNNNNHHHIAVRRV